MHLHRIPALAAALCAGVVLTLAASPASAVGSSANDIGTWNRVTTSSQNRQDVRAPEGGARVLVFGDSHTGGVTAPMYADSRGCLHSSRSWPNQLREATGLAEADILDASCYGASLAANGVTLSDQVRYAESLGGLGPRTSDILIQLGSNDDWSRPGLTMFKSQKNCAADLIGSCGQRGIDRKRFIDPSAITPDAYVSRVEQVVDYLRYYAPQARIQLVSYTRLAPEYGRDMCLKVGPVNTVIPESWPIADSHRNLVVAQREAARRLNLGFVDVDAATAGHSSCAPDSWVTGTLDGSDQFRNFLVWHPTATANWVTADQVRSNLRG
ncbi:SGNH/GDSL hydrolase family protein [Corynebacterium sp. CCM 9204]|uniref:SGNH/GDSL hydrolase family protein n=1 Tax=Corynebacterium sp. CCM 9204 TaxID=3057616 RepID=UPI00352319A3